MTTAEQLFVFSEQCVQRHIARFRSDHNRETLLVRPIVSVETVIVSEASGDCDGATGIGRYKTNQVVALRIVTIERQNQIRVLFAQLAHVPISE